MLKRMVPVVVAALLAAGVIVVLADGPPSIPAMSVPKVTAAPPDPGDGPSAVLVVYRTNSPDLNKEGMGDSEEIARYYARRRGIPEKNLLGIRVEFEGDTSLENKQIAWPWEAYRKRLVEPVRRKLDDLGRARIRYIVTTYGMPPRVNLAHKKRNESADLALGSPFAIDAGGTNFKYAYTIHPGPRYGAPRFREVRARQEAGAPDGITYLVTRIDGASVPVCKAIIDGAIYADTYSVAGYAYLDNRYGAYTDDELREWGKTPRYVSYADVDKTLALSRLDFQAAGITVRQQPDYEVIGEEKTGLVYTDGGPASEAPRALFYTGWYNYGQYRNVWDWLPGSVAVDFDSISLFAPNTVFASFGTMALFHGATGVVGVFEEPGTGGHPMPDVLVHYYLKGYSFAEAAWLSVPSKPFFATLIGDPLMCPYGRVKTEDKGIEPPKVILRRDGGILRAVVEITGEAEVARARMVVAEKEDASLLSPPDRRAGLYAREHLLGAALPSYRPVKVGIVAVDPAGNTSRLWLDWKG